MSAATEFDDFDSIGKGEYVLASDLVWEIGGKGSGWFLTVPKGFRFESSIPWFMRWLVSQDHRPWLMAAAVHDYLLEFMPPPSDDPGKATQLLFDRAFCAGEWFRAVRAMKKHDNLRSLARAAYYGVVFRTVR